MTRVTVRGRQKKQNLDRELNSTVGLQKNIPTPIPHDDRSIEDPMWDSPEIDYFKGFVALSDDFVEEKGLPRSMRYPWDSSKGIYVFHSHHSLHCVVSPGFDGISRKHYGLIRVSSSFFAWPLWSGTTTKTSPGTTLTLLTVSMFFVRTRCAMQMIRLDILGAYTPRQGPAKSFQA